MVDHHDGQPENEKEFSFNCPEVAPSATKTHFFLNFSLYSQANLLNARVPQDIGQLNEKQVESNDEEPLEYGFIDDRDILWSKTVWEIIDLDEIYPSECGNEHYLQMQWIYENCVKDKAKDEG